MLEAAEQRCWEEQEATQRRLQEQAEALAAQVEVTSTGGAIVAAAGKPMDTTGDVVHVTRDMGKAPEVDPNPGWTLVGGAGRCTACLKDDAQCSVNMKAITKWEEEVAAGKKFVRHLSSTNCA